MAVFTYDARYKGNECATNLSEEISSAIEALILTKDTIETRVRNYNPKEGFISTFKISGQYESGQDYTVLLGIKGLPGKAANTESSRLQFEGDEAAILKTKSGLLSLIENLELK
ncbi:Uncharacterised protein [uncultured archaeon]|nr:Uncharacterised protein [uncultured archaeon]